MLLRLYRPGDAVIVALLAWLAYALGSVIVVWISDDHAHEPSSWEYLATGGRERALGPHVGHWDIPVQIAI